MRIAFQLLVAALGCVAAFSCSPRVDSGLSQTGPTPGSAVASATEAPTPEPPTFRFTDITQKAGLRFTHNNGAFGAALLPETMGSGCVFFDYDGDGDQDVFLVNGRNWTKQEVAAYERSPVSEDEYSFLVDKSKREKTKNVRRAPPNKPYKRTVNALFRNNGNGSFSNVTSGSGLDIEMQGMGAAAADYDADGRVDLCVTSYGRLYLFRNEGGGRFRDVSARSGVEDSQWSTCAAWFDYDRDGRLDLYVGRYLKWTFGTDFFVTLDGRSKSYGWPLNFPSETSLLFHNEGGGRFREVSEKAGIAKRLNVAAGAGEAGVKKGSRIAGAALGVVVCDPNADGWPDLIVANDLRSNFLFLNRKNGTFHEEGVKSGIARGKTGKARGGMGIDAADIDRSGRASVAIGHFNADIMGLWRDSGGGAFTDIAGDTGVGPASSTFLTFGLLFADFNNDALPELLAANGHVDPTVHNYLILVTYAQRPLLFLNETPASSSGSGAPPRFRDVAEEVGLEEPLVARGLSVADIDVDGDLDILLTVNGGGPRLLRNDGGNKANSLRVVLRGSSANRDAIGAHVEARVGKETVRRDVRTGSSYLSQNELPLTIGLGQAAKVDSLQVRWADGKTASFANIAANQHLTITQSAGIVKRRPLRRP
jgi:hypothetical protein